MANRLHLDPDNLRALADRHDLAAARIREAGRIPEGWLGRFRSQYGTIAEPVRAALTDYFDRRHRRSEQQAAKHERTRDILRAAAQNFESRDRESGQDIGSRGRGFDGVSASGGPVPGSLPSTAANPVIVNPAMAASNTAPMPVHGRPAASPDIREDVGPAPVPAVGPVAANTLNRLDVRTSGLSVRPSVFGDNARTQEGAARVGDSAGAPATPSTGGPAGIASAVPSAAAAPGPVAVPGQAAGPTPVSGLPAAPLGPAVQPVGGVAASPLGTSATGGTRQRPRAANADIDSSDLKAARTLLSAVLHAASAMAPTVEWSVAALRSPVGMALFLTTNEGRGWLPPGLYLPRNVSMPWRRDDAVGVRDSDRATWEHHPDPARILVEFARIWGPIANARLTALASSTRIDPALREDISGAESAERVEPEGVLNLRGPGPHTIDRLGFAGSADALAEAAGVPRASRAAKGIQLCVDAHNRVRRAGATPVAAVPVEQLRERILALLEAAEPVPEQWWAELRHADSALAEAIRSHWSVDRDAVRALVFQRRCTELVLLLDGEPGYRRLRDQLYAYEQIVKHPAFADSPVVSAGPMGGVVPPPVAVPERSAGSDGARVRGAIVVPVGQPRVGSDARPG